MLRLYIQFIYIKSIKDFLNICNPAEEADIFGKNNLIDR